MWGIKRVELKFRDGEFYLYDNPFSQTKFKNISFKAAVGFRRFADKVAERVIHRSLVTYYVAPSEPPPSFLDAHQVKGVNWILTRSRSYLAHAPGAGKTCEAIVASQMSTGVGQTLFIVPPGLTINWAREIMKWVTREWPVISIVPVSAKMDDVDFSADYIICPDSMLTKKWVYDSLSKLNLKLIAVDEASRFKEPTSERTKALFGGQGKSQIFYGLVQNAKHAVLLDGSPMPNRPMELWTPVYGMAPEVIDFQDMHDFGVEYCDAFLETNRFGSKWNYRGASNQEKLHKKLQKDFMHVVNEDELSHPERRRSILFVDKDKRSMKVRKWEQKFLKSTNIESMDEDMNHGALAEMRQEIGLSKVDFTARYVGERLANKNESILIFAWHRSVCRALADRLKSYRPGLVLGGTPELERERIFSQFQAGTLKVIVGNIGAMGRGHNLQRADRVVFSEYSWTDELNKQCEKRASRKGSLKSIVRCDYIVVPTSLDEVVLNAVFTKAKNVKRVIG